MSLAESKTLMALSSSRMFPSDDSSVSRIWSSISFSCFLLVADCRIRAFLSSSSSGLGQREGSHHYIHYYTTILFTIIRRCSVKATRFE